MWQQVTCPLISCALDAPACSLNGYKQKYAELHKDFIESRPVFQISMATNADMGLITTGQGGKLAAWRVYTAWSKHANHVQGTLSTQEKPTRVQSCTKSDPTKELQRPRRRSTSRARLQQACPARLQRPWRSSTPPDPRFRSDNLSCHHMQHVCKTGERNQSCLSWQQSQ